MAWDLCCEWHEDFECATSGIASILHIGLICSCSMALLIQCKLQEKLKTCVLLVEASIDAVDIRLQLTCLQVC